MAFHVACPITCRRICFCSLGFRKGDKEDKIFDDVDKLEEFIKDPWLLKAREDATVQVAVPKVDVVAPPPPAVVAVSVADGGEAEELLSAQTKRAAMQRKAAAASLVAEDYARRMEIGDVEGVVKDDGGGEEQGLSNVKVMCRLCFNGENEGSEKARKMLSCKSCGKKYHRGCLKSWAQHRDLFHWSSWTCPSCRICEVCRRTGDPNKFMFCKRCDGAYHCYCQHPPHKNVGHGPYLCPKHTKCHSCGSNVPGNGLSVRWFLGYTCCDACGRLFVKGNYCPVCLKVYRDSEATPMVCCDICQRWVHCQCDGISDEKYMQFQVDNNLQYKCATCRGECYQVRDLEDAVHELWRRKDSSDQELIANLRAAAGLPTQEDIFSISPFSDDEENGPIASKNEYGRSLKFSLKGLVDKSPKKNKEYGKKSSNKKYSKKRGYQTPLIGKTEAHHNFDGLSDAQSMGGYSTGDNKDEDMHPLSSGGPDIYPYPIGGSLDEGASSVLKHKFINEVTAGNENRIVRSVRLKSKRPQGPDIKDGGKHGSESKTSAGPKLVIHFGARNRNVTSSPKSDTSSCHRDQDLATSNGNDDDGQQRVNERHMDRQEPAAALDDGKGENLDYPDQVKPPKVRGKEAGLIKIKKVNPEASDSNSKFGTISPVKTRVSLGKRSADVYNDDNSHRPSVSHSLPKPKDLKPLLKLKFKNPTYHENPSSWAPHGEEEKSSVKGQRSKRKRPSPPLKEKAWSANEEEDTGSERYEGSPMDGVMEANWILQKLGKDAVGKKVEVHQPSNNSWHKGTVTEVFEGTSTLAVALADGTAKTLDLDTQGIRFDSKKQKLSNT